MKRVFGAPNNSRKDVGQTARTAGSAGGSRFGDTLVSARPRSLARRWPPTLDWFPSGRLRGRRSNKSKKKIHVALNFVQVCQSMIAVFYVFLS
ncbi:unnamed protein product [Arctia plantaginis]|uniref:Uncharacterized protein n=1 Tax=Arctia plantaginis TaxID=874455 RepID=A0A8S0Z3I3_ARCPL|nr:unnamed protein product [Arctia plantaginis]CAB3235186.1 unnamed protein product [Arctia plantaginis]